MLLNLNVSILNVCIFTSPSFKQILMLFYICLFNPFSFFIVALIGDSRNTEWQSTAIYTQCARYFRVYNGAEEEWEDDFLTSHNDHMWL